MDPYERLGTTKKPPPPQVQIINLRSWVTWAYLGLAVTFAVAAVALILACIFNANNPKFVGTSLYFSDPEPLETDVDLATLNVGCTNNTFGTDTHNYRGKTYFGYKCPALENVCLENICRTSGQCEESLISGATCASDYECNNSTINLYRCDITTCSCVVNENAIITAEYTPNITEVGTALNYSLATNVSGLYTILNGYIQLQISLNAPASINNETDMDFLFSLPDVATADTTAVNIGESLVRPALSVTLDNLGTLAGIGVASLSDGSTGLADLSNVNPDYIGSGAADDYAIVVNLKYKLS